MMKHSDTGGNIINKKRCPHLFTGTGDLNLSNYALSFLLYIQDGGGREHATSKRKWSLICMRLTQVSELKSRPMSPCNKQPNTATDYRDQTNFGKCVCVWGGGGLHTFWRRRRFKTQSYFLLFFRLGFSSSLRAHLLAFFFRQHNGHWRSFFWFR